MNWNDKKMVIEKLSYDPLALEYASKELQNDKEVVIKAVSKEGFALEYASEELKNDKDVVMMAVSKDGIALKHASQELQNDKELLLILEKNKKNIHSNLKKWYEEKMKVLAKYREEELLSNIINTESIKKPSQVKVKKF